MKTTGRPGRVSFAAMGTTAVVLSTDDARLEEARAAVAAEVAAMDRAASRFRADSDLSRVNAGAGRPVEVDQFFIDALDVGLDAAALTDGAVDPTIGQSLVLLGYDVDFAQLTGRHRDPDHLGAGAGPVVRVGARRGPAVVRIDRARRTVHIPVGIRLDLGATAKARCADRAAAAAAAATGTGVLVSLGGDLAVAGPCPPDGWTVLVTDRHDAPLDGPGQAIALHSGGLATSSVTVRHWQHGSEPAHHLIDPANGRPAEVVWRTVSVAAASCVAANIVSTAAMIKGRAAPAWLASLNLPARLIGVDGTVRVVAGWPADDHTDDHTDDHGDDHTGDDATGAGAMTAALVAVAYGKSLWYLTRGSGIVTQLLLTASLVGGILTTFEWTPAATARFVVPRLHRNVSLLVVVFLVLHVATTVLDGYARVGWLDAIVPLRSAYKPLWVGLGALAVDLLIAVIITSLLRARIGRRTWRAVHWLSYASWPIAMIHGFGIGSDTPTRWMLAINVACVVLVTGFCLWRVGAPPRGGARLGDAPIGAGAASRALAAARHRNPNRSPARTRTRARTGAAPRAGAETTTAPTATASAGTGARNRDRR